MSNTIIRVENLGKKYVIGHQKQERYTALRDVIANGAKSVGRRLLKPLGKGSSDPTVEEFWALKDVSFEIQQGDRVGIIGRNGAGKSTLLKILSRITEPTQGSIRIKGRVASLLEVGTGFHPELTGRENIYLNGAILGMGKAEIKRKFDEIVAFAEVEKFLDTPVKRYSSGMYVRLAFAVAAHLEPEILVVDEVLAVGDAQFQKKCLGKMGDVAKEGRTVLFVSHNMAAVEALCSKGILLEQGQIKKLDSAKTVAIQYQKNTISSLSKNEHKQILGFSDIHGIVISNLKYYIEYSNLYNGFNLKIEFDIFAETPHSNIGIGLTISTVGGVKVAMISPSITHYIIDSLKGNNKCIFECRNIEKYLAGGDYTISIWLSKPKREYILKIEDALMISIPAYDVFDTGTYFESHIHGLVPLPLRCRIQKSASNFIELGK
ncbi:ABC transporter, ATP-binding protein [Coleofasciculus chthonoplastes PCC 7420]|uniref:ABC transporter, ATP-binding protein n=1 Tax=Coleofasciculus chthonoplastes PCC 7420 TaxID=118168 RepID=B4VS35_9CYAN|nr:polysaccharide ABC transporter ATP-binding protein [Coleofasciculus chthonoplastes]EDX75161.1 ABC transporter, ATP-binding protein [Coleofasciculus chthonoplastes PCC 7420]